MTAEQRGASDDLDLGRTMAGHVVDSRRALKLLRRLGELPTVGRAVDLGGETHGQWGKAQTVASPGRPRPGTDGSLIVACVEQRADGVVLPGAMHGIVTRRRLTVRVKTDGSMTLRHARMIQGRTTSGRTYARWVTQGWALARFRESDGAVVFTQHERARNFSSTASATLFAGEHPGHLAYDVLEACGLRPSVTERREAYPLVPTDAATHGYGGRFSLVLPHQVWAAFAGAEDVGQVTRRLFGARRYRKDLVRAVARIAQSPASDADQTCLAEPWGRLATAWAARGLVPADHLVAHLTGAGASIAPVLTEGRSVEVLRRHLRALDEHSVHRLLTAPAPEEVEMMALDVLKMAPHPGVRRVRGWRDLHDQLSDVHARYTWEVRQAREAALQQEREAAWAAITAHERERLAAEQAARTVPIELDEHQLRLEGTTAGGREIVLARTVATLEEWGMQMGHCIWSYGTEMRSRRSWLGAAMKPGTERPLANFEVEATYCADGTPKSLVLRQLLGRRNRTLPPDVREDIVAHLLAAGVAVDARGYWGDGRRGRR